MFYFLGSLTFCYLHYHKILRNVNLHEESVQGIYYILSLEAPAPYQFRLLVPGIFLLIKNIFVFLPDKVVLFSLSLVLTFTSVTLFYNILNSYFRSKSVNQWTAFVLFYPMIWQFLILNQIYECTDFASVALILAGYLCIINNYKKLLLVIFFTGTLNHYSIGFLVPMYIFFNIKRLPTKEIIFYTVLMSLIFLAELKIMQSIFSSNPGSTVIFSKYEHNALQFVKQPIHMVIRNVLLFFGGLHLFILYFFISGKWKRFKTGYLYISAFNVLIHVIMVFVMFTSFEARNYFVILPMITILFLMFFSTFKGSFLEPLDNIISS